MTDRAGRAWGRFIVELARKLFRPGTRSLANLRALGLLKQNLTSFQYDQYLKRGCFDVIGERTGNRYRISHGASMNVSQLDANGRCLRRLCFHPRGGLVEGDVLLAQKLALESFELDALAVANTIEAGSILFRVERPSHSEVNHFSRSDEELGPRPGQKGHHQSASRGNNCTRLA